MSSRNPEAILNQSQVGQLGSAAISLASEDVVLTQNQVGEVIDRLKIRGVLLYTLIVACLGFLFDSFDTSIISYLMPSMAAEWHLAPAVLGLIASSAIWGTALGQYIWGPSADKFGRRWAFQSTLLMFGLVTGVAAFMWNSASMIVARFLAGTGLGGFIPLDAIVISEMSPTKVRGRMVSTITLFFPGGQLLAAGAALLLLPIIGWRMMFLVGAIPAILAWVARRYVPESPRWLNTKGRNAEAIESLRKLGASEQDLREVAAKHVPQLQRQVGEVKKSSLGELFSGKYAAAIAASWATWIVIFGYFGFMLWFPSILVSRFHLTLVTSLTYTVLVAGTGMLGRLCGIYLIEKMGRKPLLIYTYIIAGLLLISFMTVTSAEYILPLACAYYFFADQSGVAEVTYPPELYPTHLRGLGTGLAIGVGRTAAALGPIVAGILLSANLYSVIWILFGGVYLVAAVVIAALGTETKGRSLEAVTQAV